MVETEVYEFPVVVGEQHDTIGVVFGEAEVVLGLLRAAEHTHVVGGLEGAAAKDLLLPVIGLDGSVFLNGVPAIAIGGDAGAVAGELCPLVLVVQEVIGGEQGELFGELIKADEAIVGDGGLSAGVAAALGGDDDDAIGAAGAIDGGGGGIFQHVDRGDVLGRDEIERVVHLDPVDYIKG